MIKLLHFITDTNIGGAGRLLCNQIKNMDTNEFKISVALPKGSALVKELSALPCSLIECESGADSSFSPKSLLESYRIIKRERPDIVHSHASLSSRIAATALNIPSRVFTRHCSFPISRALKTPIFQAIIGYANGVFSTSAVAVAESAKQDLIDMGCNKQRIITVINGSEPVRVISDSEKNYILQRLGLKKDDFIITIFARLEEYKGHKTFIEAAKICKRYYPEFRFIIVGDGSQKRSLERYAAELDVLDTVYFAGFCEDVAPYFNITDINVNCSYGTETSSLALSEGMSLSIPSVVSDYAGNTHMVKNTVNGLIFPQKNAQALAMAIIRLYRDKKLYSKCALGAYQRYTNEFTADAMAQKMMDFYRNEYKSHSNTSSKGLMAKKTR